jgi:hypothetical protein
LLPTRRWKPFEEGESPELSFNALTFWGNRKGDGGVALSRKLPPSDAFRDVGEISGKLPSDAEVDAEESDDEGSFRLDDSKEVCCTESSRSGFDGIQEVFGVSVSVAIRTGDVGASLSVADVWITGNPEAIGLAGAVELADAVGLAGTSGCNSGSSRGSSGGTVSSFGTVCETTVGTAGTADAVEAAGAVDVADTVDVEGTSDGVWSARTAGLDSSAVGVFD